MRINNPPTFQTQQRSIWLQPHAITNTAVLSTQTGDYGVATIGSAVAGGQLYWSAHFPDDALTLTRAEIVVVASDSGDIRWSIGTDGGADGESLILHSDAIAITTRAMLVNEIDRIDVLAAFTPYLPEDFLGIAFNRDGADPLDTVSTLFVLGLLLEFD